MEAGIANNTRQDDVVLSLVNGKFGRRLSRISERYAEEVRSMEVEWGECFNISEVEEAVRDADIVTMVHNETSTGILNPAPEIAELANEHDALFVMETESLASVVMM